MNRQTKTWPIAVAATALLFAAAVPGWPQSRGGFRGGSAGSLRTSHAAMTVGTPLNPNFAPIFGSGSVAPGLGFSFSHLAAVGGQSRGRLRASLLTPAFSRIIPLYYFPGEYLYAQPQPSVIVVEQPPQTIVVQQGPPDSAEETAEPEAADSASQPPAPQADAGQLILVRRDGQLLFATAFMVSGDRLTYITPEGLRRTLSLADLDKDATEQLNDASGNTISLPD